MYQNKLLTYFLQLSDTVYHLHNNFFCNYVNSLFVKKKNYFNKYYRCVLYLIIPILYLYYTYIISVLYCIIKCIKCIVLY